MLRIDTFAEGSCRVAGVVSMKPEAPSAFLFSWNAASTE
jgi:hypothetical protein